LNILYDLVIHLYGVLLQIAVVFHPKASRWVQGRQNYWQNLKNDTKSLTKPVWIHCASLGEFEQGRPIIAKIKEDFPQQNILLSFFSPSGYEVRKTFPLADHVCYMALDTPQNARRFVEIIDPGLVIFVKYEFWYNHLKALNQKKIPYVFIALKLHETHFLFRPVFKMVLHQVKKAKYLFTQNKFSSDLLQQRNIPSIVAGDPRVDRVVTLNQDHYPVEISSFFNGSKTIIFGSLWEKDWDIVKGWINRQTAFDNCIIAPHEISDFFIKKILDQINRPAAVFSQLSHVNIEPYCLIIDNVGMLASLYQNTYLAYIGGGFNHGIHNTLEPMAAGIPVIIGKKFRGFVEAEEMVERKAFLAINNGNEFEKAINQFMEDDFYRNAKTEIQEFLNAQQGATKRIMATLNEYFK